MVSNFNWGHFLEKLQLRALLRMRVGVFHLRSFDPLGPFEFDAVFCCTYFVSYKRRVRFNAQIPS